MATVPITLILILVTILASGGLFIVFLIGIARIERRLMHSRKTLSDKVMEKTRAEAALRRTLNEKEMLLREIHHRVKNNLQIVSSLLRMQARRCGDEKTRTVLKESLTRIQAMALIHENFRGADDPLSVSVREYFQDLAMNLFETYSANPEILTLECRFDDLSLAIDAATPCGLIINELMTNALKHAFPDGRGGSITIEFTRRGDEITLRIADDGVGLSEDFSPETSETQGLMLVKNLVENQLGGTIEIRGNGGAEFVIRFREPEYAKRI